MKTTSKQTVLKTMKILTLVIASFTVLPWVYAATITVDTANATWASGSVTVPVTLTPQNDSTSSVNFTINYDAAKYDINTVTLGAAGTAANKLVDFNRLNTTSTKIIVYGLNATAIGSGTLVQVKLNVVTNAVDGVSTISLTNAVAASPTATTVATTLNNGSITLDATAPKVTITKPAAGAKVGTSTVTVEGTVDDLAITNVLINGTSIAVTNGAFSASATLTEGNNTITVTATDSKNNTGTATVTISYKLGDVNEDGLVDTIDVNSAKSQLLGKTSLTTTADINKDGIITAIDLQSIINRLP